MRNGLMAAAQLLRPSGTKGCLVRATGQWVEPIRNAKIFAGRGFSYGGLLASLAQAARTWRMP